MTAVEPVTPGIRYVSLDVMRGIAILGTLGTNIWIFTNPEGFIGYVSGVGRAEGVWRWVEAVLQQLCQGKFLGLLTVMFGIGLAIQQHSAQRRGDSWPGPSPVRAGLLFVDGVVNFLLFTEFDVLTGYAVTGLVVAFVLATSVRSQRIWLSAAVMVHVAILVVIVGAVVASPPPEDNPPVQQQPNPYAEGSFWDLVVFRVDHLLVFRAETILILPVAIAMFIAGAMVFRAGVLAPGGAELRRRLMIVGFIVALPIDLIVGLFWGSAGMLVGRYLTAAIIAFGVLAAVAQFYVAGRVPGIAGRALGAVGRMALSCYVLQNALAGALCYGWGLGLAQRMGPGTVVPGTIGVYALVVAVLMVFSKLWLSRWERGPLEMLWQASYQRLTTRR
ncbi:Predicted membrane protein [Mycobacteroides abscessus]|nr:Predicted membrane protein [Mycobacteroides abscessus]